MLVCTSNFLSSCKREAISIPSESREVSLLKKRFGFNAMFENKDFRNNTKLINGLKLKKVSSRSYGNFEGLIDLSNVTEFQFDDGTTVLSIPFLSDIKEVLIVSYKDDPTTTVAYDIDKNLVLTNHVDQDGNGSMELVFYDEIIKKSYSFGNEIRDTSIIEVSPEIANNDNKTAGFCQLLPNETFRHCFDRMYDTICDDFWGCIAWHTQPQVPILAAIVCKCKK